MTKKKCAGDCDCIPVKPGYYWATWKPLGHRIIVEVGKNGLGHTRVFAPRCSSSMGLEEFTDWNGPITERRRK